MLCGSCAKQTVHMECQVLFYLKSKTKNIFIMPAVVIGTLRVYCEMIDIRVNIVSLASPLYIKGAGSCHHSYTYAGFLVLLLYH